MLLLSPSCAIAIVARMKYSNDTEAWSVSEIPVFCHAGGKEKDYNSMESNVYGTGMCMP